MKTERIFLALTFLLLFALAAHANPFRKEEIRFVTEKDDIVYSLFPGRTEIVEYPTDLGEKMLETYVNLKIPSQNLEEVQQWNIRLNGKEYRVQDLYDFDLDTGGMVDQ
ncbi:MAG: hypothetical protein GX791_04910 [Synergistaceae bacterium]|nr:hypothetical protein [Synergistaceae bacterium]